LLSSDISPGTVYCALDFLVQPVRVSSEVTAIRATRALEGGFCLKLMSIYSESRNRTYSATTIRLDCSDCYAEKKDGRAVVRKHPSEPRGGLYLQNGFPARFKEASE